MKISINQSYILIIGFLSVFVSISTFGYPSPNISASFYEIDAFRFDSDDDGLFDSLELVYKISVDDDYTISVAIALWDNGDSFNMRYEGNYHIEEGISSELSYKLDPVPFEDEFYVDVNLFYNGIELQFEQLGFYYLYPSSSTPKVFTGGFEEENKGVSTVSAPPVKVVLNFNSILISFGLLLVVLRRNIFSKGLFV